MATVVAPHFDQRIRLLMDRAGGLCALASQVGVSHPAVKLWLRGTIPHAKTLDLICARCHVRREWLVDGVEPIDESVVAESPAAMIAPYAVVAPEFYRLYDAFKETIAPLPKDRKEAAYAAFFEMILKVFGK